jgi:branched-chain amino acid transport system substrate-binding protein
MTLLKSIAAMVAVAAFSAAIPGVASAQIKVGFTVSASGPGAALGQPQMRTVQALPKEIAGQKVTYIALDDESDPTKAVQNARKLITEEKVDVLVGSSLTPVSLPLVDIAFETKTPLLTLAAAAVMVQPLDDKKKWVYKVVPNDDLMAKVILGHIAKSGVKKLGYIGVSDGYGEGYYKELSRLAPTMGIELTTHEVYARSDASVTGQVLKVIATKPDAVFIASAGTPAVLPQKALRERGYKGPIYQTHGIATEEFIKLGGKDVEGAVFAGEAFTIAPDFAANDPFKKPAEEYIAAYKSAQNNQMPNLFGAHVWDVVALLGRAAPNALKAGKPGSPEFRAALRDELEKSKDVYLNNGLSNMSPTDHNGYDERSAFLIKVQDGQFRLAK